MFVIVNSHPEQGPLGLFRDLLCPQNPIFDTQKETCAKKWLLRAQQFPLHATRTLLASFENRLLEAGNTQQLDILSAPALRQESALQPSVKDVHHGRLSPLVAPVVDDYRAAEGLCRGGRAGARLERSGGGVVRATDAIAQL